MIFDWLKVFKIDTKFNKKSKKLLFIIFGALLSQISYYILEVD